MNNQKRQAGSDTDSDAEMATKPQHWKMLLKREISRISVNEPAGNGSERNALWLEQISRSIEAAPNLITPGIDRATVVNIHTGIKETISLNPKLSAIENAALYLKKSKKTKKNELAESRELNETSRLLESLRSAYDRICRLSDTSDADEVSGAIAAATQALCPILPELAQPGEDRKTATQSVPFRHVIFEGWDIYLGRTETENDELSLRFAAPADLWFHAAGCAGSHCIIRRPNGTPPPPSAVVEAAASLAAWYSKARNAPCTEVHFTEARFVGKRRGAPAGEVTIERWKSIKVAPRGADHRDFCEQS